MKQSVCLVYGINVRSIYLPLNDVFVCQLVEKIDSSSLAAIEAARSVTQ